eukprot:366276-Chlamydomonas_euryale.AAC.4
MGRKHPTPRRRRFSSGANSIGLTPQWPKLNPMPRHRVTTPKLLRSHASPPGGNPKLCPLPCPTRTICSIPRSIHTCACAIPTDSTELATSMMRADWSRKR